MLSHAAATRFRHSTLQTGGPSQAGLAVPTSQYLQFERSVSSVCGRPAIQAACYSRHDGELPALEQGNALLVRKNDVIAGRRLKRPVTPREAKIRRLMSSYGMENDVEVRVASIITRRYSNVPAPLSVTRGGNSRFSTYPPKIVTIIVAGEEKPRQSIRVFLNKNTLDSLTQLMECVGDLFSISGISKVFSIHGAPVIQLEDLFTRGDVFLALSERQLADRIDIDSQLTINPGELKVVDAYQPPTSASEQKDDISLPPLPDSKTTYCGAGARTQHKYMSSRMPVRVRKHPLMAEAVSNKKRIEELYKMVTKGRRRPSMLDELR